MRLYGLIGYPLGHSFSKQYFIEKFDREGLKDCTFEAFPIPSIEEFPALLQANPTLKGLSVTIPYKEQVLPYITDLSEEVKYIGATNSIKIVGDRLIAYNTDIIGFEQSFIKSLNPAIHTKALILGTGGAAKAVQYVLKKLGINFLLVTRNLKKDGFIHYTDINAEIMSEYTIIINCSPVGMSPNENVCPDIPYHLLTQNHYLYDLVYKPAETLFLQKGKEKNATVDNGYDMLLLQADASWEIWNS
ncbi:MAG: shikimate dehydrogenase [Sphingobacteriales bacterium]|nr:shikimate dehydrogenase [Sphingobacteriales bacterium]